MPVLLVGWDVRVRRFWSTTKPLNKLKVLVGFYMVVTKVEAVYELTLPSDVKRLLSYFTLGISLGLTSSNEVLTCMGPRGGPGGPKVLGPRGFRILLALCKQNMI